MSQQFVETPRVTLQALPEELPFIDEAVRGYLQILQAGVLPSAERDEVMAQLRSFRGRYLDLLCKVQTTKAHKKQPAHKNRNEGEQLVSWQVTSFELIAFGSAVIAYLRLLDVTNAPRERSKLVLHHLATFEKRYLDTLPSSTSR